MKIVIVGAGAMGCVFGACLAESGCETVMLDVRSDVVEAIEASGITVRRDRSERGVPVRATMNVASVGRVDIAIVLVKSFHTLAAAESIRPIVDGSTIVATLQNGIGNAQILAEIFDPGQVVQGVTAESGTSLGPGVVDHPGNAATYPARLWATPSPPPSDSRRCSAQAGSTRRRRWDRDRDLEEAGRRCFDAPGPRLTRDGMRAAHAAATHAATGGRHRARGRGRGQALGHAIDADERIAYIHELLMAVEDAKGSMVQDIEAGRRTEIDMINGGIVREGETHGVAVPINRTLVALVKGWESIRGLG